MLTYRPEIVNDDVEDAQDHNEDNGAELRLEANNDHDAGHRANQDDQDAPKAPLAHGDEADEQEDQQHATSELEVHLAVFLVELR